ncbi:50S ribosomal protein L24 [Sediminitomix flava]|uniref:Large ribosomal subunit protein uL24 n=1 Tax=Sediminitomix flava TaxID=379075 RepID=A0A315Z671_SEDFL|nr:50S ribosomal protein L24 [Sediminitomix flava]PWJ39353.1 large subunit ribosomal protein L24 [Sediminitomix flava]
MRKKFHIKTGDKVEVIAGNHKGQQGTVKAILAKNDRVIVEGVNMVTKHVKPTAEKPEGGVKKEEAGIHISNVMLVDPKSGETTRTGRKADENGKLKRYSKKSDQFID